MGTLGRCGLKNTCSDTPFVAARQSKSADDTPGQRIEDLYEVCGQAQKSITWISSPEKKSDIFTHLLRREAMRQEDGGPSRFEVGGCDLLQTTREMSRLCPVKLSINIVQPGVSKARATRDQLLLLSVAENYLLEHANSRLDQSPARRKQNKPITGLAFLFI